MRECYDCVYIHKDSEDHINDELRMQLTKRELPLIKFDYKRRNNESKEIRTFE